jgi:hypothetical protein
MSGTLPPTFHNPCQFAPTHSARRTTTHPCPCRYLVLPHPTQLFPDPYRRDSSSKTPGGCMKLEQGFLVCRHSDGPSTCSWLLSGPPRCRDLNKRQFPRLASSRAAHHTRTPEGLHLDQQPNSRHDSIYRCRPYQHNTPLPSELPNNEPVHLNDLFVVLPRPGLPHHTHTKSTCATTPNESTRAATSGGSPPSGAGTTQLPTRGASRTSRTLSTGQRSCAVCGNHSPRVLRKTAH